MDVKKIETLLLEAHYMALNGDNWSDREYGALLIVAALELVKGKTIAQAKQKIRQGVIDEEHTESEGKALERALNFL